MLFLEDAIRICLADAAFEEISRLEGESEFLEEKFKEMLDSPNFAGSSKLSEIGQNLQDRQTAREQIVAGEQIPSAFWAKLIECVKPEVMRIGKATECPEIQITIGKDFGSVKTRTFQRKHNVGGRPSNTRIFINGELLTKTDFARRYNPSYIDSPMTAERMSWDNVKKMCTELFAQGKIYVARIEAKNDLGEWIVQEVIGG